MWKHEVISNLKLIKIPNQVRWNRRRHADQCGIRTPARSITDHFWLVRLFASIDEHPAVPSLLWHEDAAGASVSSHRRCRCRTHIVVRILGHKDRRLR